jgi:hypothetical protein
VVALIGVIGVVRGFGGLALLERVALGVTLALIALLTFDFLSHGLARAGDGLDLPPVPDTGAVEVLLLLGGIVICVQGSRRFAT